MKLVLFGFAGSGKTTVSEILGGVLGLPVFEMDSEILKISGCRDINEIFKKYGEKHFRDLETKVAASTRNIEEAIISTGGGTLMRDKNIECLRGPDAKFIYLRTSFETAAKRLQPSTDRPLFKDKESARKLYESRLQIYKDNADYIVDTDNLSPEQVAVEIAAVLGA